MECLFCHPEAGKEFVRKNHNVNVELLAESENFYVMPMVGAGTEGYLLLVSRGHYPSMADLPAKLLEELEGLLKLVKGEMRDAYGSPIVFEHGSTCSNVSCMIDHAHLHIVPVPKGFSILKDIQSEYPMLRLKQFEDLALWSPGGAGKAFYDVESESWDGNEPEFKPFAGYLYYEEQDGTGYIHQLDTVEGFQSQYLRKVLLTKLGIDEWDWKKSVNQGQVDDTVRRLGHLRDIIGKSRWRVKDEEEELLAASIVAGG